MSKSVSSPPIGRTAQSDLATQRILYLEDEKDLVTLVQLIFSRQGYLILGAPSLAQAKEIMERESIDLFFLDLHLPDGTGWEMLDYLGQHRLYAHTPKVIMSAQILDQKRQAELGEKDQVEAVICKPFQVSALMDVTKRLLGNGKMNH